MVAFPTREEGRDAVRRIVPIAAAAMVVAGLGAAAGLGARSPVTPAGRASEQPNVLVVRTDDQTAESLGIMSNVRNLLGAQGTTFDNSFVGYALDSPSQATFLTGQYPHNHGVRGNAAPAGGYTRLDGRETLPVWLQRAGYRTFHVGKYLDGYGARNPREIPPGYTEWYGSVDPTSSRYWGFTLNENGRLVTYGRPLTRDPALYQTDVYAGKAGDLIRREAGVPGPFYLDLSFLAPHNGAPRVAGDPARLGTPEPAPRHKGRLATLPLPRPPSFNEADVSDKPAVIRNKPLLGAALVGQVTNAYRQRLESLLAVDDAVAQLYSTLQQTGELERTVIVFTSASGYFQGEHRVPQGQVLPYEPAIRVPLVIRGPGVPRDVHLHQNVSNVDLAPTIIDFSGATPGRDQDGVSLVKLMRDPRMRLGRDLLIEGPPGTGGFATIRTNRYQYTEWADGGRELYDLAGDPAELQSRHADPAYQGREADLAQKLAALRLCHGRYCRQPPQLNLALDLLKGPDCRRSRVQALVNGPDKRRVERVALYVDGRRVLRDGRGSFPRAVVKAGSASAIRLTVVLRDGRAVTLDGRYRGCPR
jgi:arylsulfatase A-like enzyme